MTTGTSGGGCLSAVIYLAIAGLGFYWFAFPEDARKVLYSVEYGVPVVVDPRPKDCDFFELPYGFKGCHYEVVVRPYRSEGKQYVYVSWERKER
jgi:hypothetical protein